jgi:two-component system, LytTR family, response regulator
MINCIIIDDEPGNVSILKKMLHQYCPDVHVTAEALSATDAIQVIRELRPQLVFLDIEMPGINAFDLLNALMPVTFEIIFVTAFADYGVKAFKYCALDYLLKPVDIDELIRAVQKAKTRIAEKNINQRLELFLDQRPVGGHTFSKIAVPTLDGLVFYPVEEIICCIAKGTYTQIELIEDKDMLVSSTLKEIEEALPASIFCRIHHSYLINMNHIKKYYKGKGGYIEMNNGRTMQVSARKREEFLSRLKH